MFRQSGCVISFNYELCIDMYDYLNFLARKKKLLLSQKRLSFQLIYFTLYVSIYLFISPLLQKKKKKKIHIEQLGLQKRGIIHNEKFTRNDMGFQDRRMRIITFSFQRTTFCFHNELGQFLAIL